MAISNEGGGHLILGIANKLPRLVVGTSAFLSPIKVTEQIFRTIGFRVDVEEVHHPDGRVLVFSITAKSGCSLCNYKMWSRLLYFLYALARYIIDYAPGNALNVCLNT